jgi:uncharacterized protein
MDNRPKVMVVAASACLMFADAAGAPVEPMRIHWSDLRPENQESGATVAPDNADSGRASGETLSLELQGKTVELTGYLLPVDREGDLVYEFMLLPWAGACSHTPLPPNQLIHVIPQDPYRLSEIYEPVSVSGTLKPSLEKTQLFILDGVTVVESGYSVSRALVAKAESVPDAVPPTKTTPWSFMNR